MAMVKKKNRIIPKKKLPAYSSFPGHKNHFFPHFFELSQPLRLTRAPQGVETRWLGWQFRISVCLETRWLGHIGGFYVPGCYCTVLILFIETTFLTQPACF